MYDKKVLKRSSVRDVYVSVSKYMNFCRGGVKKEIVYIFSNIGIEKPFCWKVPERLVRRITLLR